MKWNNEIILFSYHPLLGTGDTFVHSYKIYVLQIHNKNIDTGIQNTKYSIQDIKFKKYNIEYKI